MDNAKCIWFTGLPCSGKTTLVKELEKHFTNCQVLDGDEIRNTPLANFVGFTPEDRTNHILRMGHLAKMFVDQGITVLCSFVSPIKSTRDLVRGMFDEGDFVEVYLNPPLSTCAKRDVKGMYAKAVAGLIPNFTGVGSAYEAPESPELKMNTSDMTVDECIERLIGVGRPYAPPYDLYIGRWNGVFHNGHNAIIQTGLDGGNHILLAVRDVKPDEKNPWTASQVQKMLQYRFKDEPRVKVIIIPDIASVNYGRGVGYAINEIKVVQAIAQISGTLIRKMISENDMSWTELVPTEISEYLLGNSK